jgi:hypothetical protein
MGLPVIITVEFPSLPFPLPHSQAMLEQAIQDIIRKQRPYYLPLQNPIKGVDNQYWLIFKHRHADKLLHNIISFLGIGEKHAAYKLLRIDPKSAKVWLLRV